MKNMLEHMVSSLVLGLLVVALAVSTVTACGGAPAPLPSTILGGPAVPIAEGQPGCPSKGPGFSAPVDATCRVYDPGKNFLGSRDVKGGRYYCSVPAGYVSCKDGNGNEAPPSTRAMCPFEGEEPTCPDFEITDPRVLVPTQDAGGADDPTQ